MNKHDIYDKSQIDKLGNTLIYLCENISPISKTHLLKLVFIIEELSIRKFGIPFFNLKFDVWKLGPVSKDLFVELSDEPVILAGYISKDVRDGKTSICARRKFSDDEFSDRELQLLEDVVTRFKYCSANELVNHTHRKDSSWYITAQTHGLLAALESGQINSTDIQIDFSKIIENEEDKLNLYQAHQDFLQQSKSLKQ